MADIYTRDQRSDLMAKVRGRGNATTEGALAAVLRAEGWSGWRRQQAVRGRDAQGAPFRVLANFIFWLTALFGCEKFRRNQERDCRDTRNLRRTD
jgi:G:T-mismatch repair DNA endonuclease (very short patch repair protein)